MTPKPKIGLCLSGGGFRASLFAMGCLRYLAEAGLLAEVEVISAVSGGSIAAAQVADKADQLASLGHSSDAFLRIVDKPFRDVVTTKSLRNIWLARSLLVSLGRHRPGRGVVLGDVLTENLFSTRALKDLPPGPQIILTATDLRAGRAFRFSRDFIGSYDFGYHDPPPAVSLGLAVAASAAVPALFPPINLSTSDLGIDGTASPLSLADGGVYDNLGLEWFQGWSSGRPDGALDPEFLIVANASAPLSPTRPRLGGWRATGRAKDVQYRQTTSLRTRWFTGELLAGRKNGVYMAAASNPRTFCLPDNTPVDPIAYEGALPSQLANAVGRLRTDLDRFLPEEADLLSYHGYWMAHARMASLYPDLAVETPSWREFADIPVGRSQALLALLERGARRRIQ